jgi:hypothetical protein
MKFRENSANFVKISHAEFEEIFDGIFCSGKKNFLEHSMIIEMKKSFFSLNSSLS